MPNFFEKQKQLELAIAKDDIATVYAMVDDADLDLENALYCAAELGKVTCAHILLTKKFNLNWQHPKTHYTALAIAVEQGHEDIVKLLIKNGADPYLSSPWTLTKNTSIIGLLPIPSSQTWLRNRIAMLYPDLELTGVCDGASWATVFAALSEDGDVLQERLLEINKIPLATFKSTIKFAKKIKSQLIKTAYQPYQHQLDELKHEINVLSEFYKQFKPGVKRREEALEKLKQKQIAQQKLFNKINQDILEKTNQLPTNIQRQLEIKSYFDILVLFQKLKSVKGYYAYERFLTDLLLLKLLLPIQLEKKGGINCLDSFSGLYNENELLQFCLSLEKIRSQTNFNHPLALRLTTGSVTKTGHVITLFYQPKRGWYLSNINADGKIGFQQANPDQLPNLITQALLCGQNDDKTKSLAFGTMLLVTQNVQKEAQLFLDTLKNDPNWQTIHAFTPGKVKLKDKTDITLLDLATYGCNPDHVRKIRAAEGPFLKRNIKSIAIITGPFVALSISIALLGLAGPLLPVVLGVATVIAFGLTLAIVRAKGEENVAIDRTKKFRRAIETNGESIEPMNTYSIWSKLKLCFKNKLSTEKACENDLGQYNQHPFFKTKTATKQGLAPRHDVPAAPIAPDRRPKP